MRQGAMSLIWNQHSLGLCMGRMSTVKCLGQMTATGAQLEGGPRIHRSVARGGLRV